MSGLIVRLFDYYVKELVLDEDGLPYLLALRISLYFLMGKGLFQWSSSTMVTFHRIDTGVVRTHCLHRNI